MRILLNKRTWKNKNKPRFNYRAQEPLQPGRPATRPTELVAASSTGSPPGTKVEHGPTDAQGGTKRGGRPLDKCLLPEAVRTCGRPTIP